MSRDAIGLAKRSKARLFISTLAIVGIVATGCSSGSEPTSGGSSTPAEQGSSSTTSSTSGSSGGSNSSSSSGPSTDSSSNGPSSTAGGSEPELSEETLTVAYPQEPANWNPRETAATAAIAPLIYNVIEPLLEQAPDGSLKPLLAESYDVSDDGKTYTFHLRSATFHDGSPMTAEDVVSSLQGNKESAVSNVSAPLGPVENISAVDEQTVEVVLNQPSRKFIQGMADRAGFIYPTGITRTDLEKHPIGTGPYAFEVYKPGTSITLQRWQDYWGKKPYFKTVEWRLIRNDVTALNTLKAGEIDMVGAVQSRQGLVQVKQFESGNQYTVTKQSSRQISWTLLNSKVSKFQDPKVRQAIAHSIDRQAVLQGAVEGYGEVTCNFLTPPTAPWGVGDYCPYNYDPDKARALLEQANASDLAIQFKHLTIAEFPAEFAVIRDGLADVGVSVNGTGVELTQWVQDVRQNHDFELTSITGGGTSLASFKCPGLGPQYCNEEYDELLNKADAALDRDKWIELKQKAVKLLTDKAYVIPMFTKNTVIVANSNISGVKDVRVNSVFDMRGLTGS